MTRGRQVTLAATAAVLLIIGSIVLMVIRRSATPEATPAPAAVTASAGASPTLAKAGGWVGTWAAAMQHGETVYRRQTLRQIVHTSVGGSQVRVRITNLYGAGALAIGSAHVARDAGTG